ncbi:response regulator transcription factor [Aromatoleum evansii]|uniref:Response regulator transcription factor n=1 Tax=Aromatoleum evansii TaxID=59406 RepID=A0ABZ1AIG1_AROEV|nr:response regulator transcription factor [Aromatoleum evansii]
MMAHTTYPPLKVLLIEDSPLLGSLLGAMLEELEGVAVVAVAGDEAEALQALQERRPDLAIVDLNLREGSGLGVLRALRAKPECYGRPATAVFTNHAHAHLRERCRALGVDRFFDKALEMDALLDYVEAVRRASMETH